MKHGSYPPSSHEENQWRVLLADDDDDTRMLMAASLRRAGFHVIENANGRELLECLGKEITKHILVISDIGMPEVDGIEVAAFLHEVHPSVPVLLVTAFGDATLMKYAKEIGVRSVFAKPVSLSMLVQAARDIAEASS